ncbi:hypothetical protein RZN05_12290 [Sphingomonas sp. HF-S4]|uniref:DUF4412 domain-containing protein n=1 Tax=Sphingomonas agrestis TaxID=3080540 RepID=A0ABU3Y8T9_9SPHN|nr:hypothetical protein [Sphingomonas sp. HF-S4]MDV3457766.1 hypothetical protein [Sphingomonas sp. HF-S4]
MRRALAAALLFAPLPAAADITAHYEMGKETLSVEVDDNGDYRAEVPGKVLLLRRGGTEYVAIFQGDKPLVIERKAFLGLAGKMALAGKPPAETDKRPVLVARGAEEQVAGRSGTLWTLKVDTPKGNTLEAVMNADRDLAPVGAVFAGVVDAGLATFAPMIPSPDFAPRLREIFAKGTPLRLVLVEYLKLRSVSKAEIDAARFALPGPVMDPSAFDAAMSAPSSDAEEVPAELPPLP